MSQGNDLRLHLMLSHGDHWKITQIHKKGLEFAYFNSSSIEITSKMFSISREERKNRAGIPIILGNISTVTRRRKPGNFPNCQP